MRQGFSLVELSIVLVILGLLTGGILAGQSLIRAAELRAVGTEYNRYASAVNSFRDKYFGLPGDLANATAFWGATHANPATCIVTVGSGTQTCNGDGSGKINATGSGATHYSENFTFWQHLGYAGLIEGSYTGRIGPAGLLDATRDNSPVSKLSNAFWFPFNWDTTNTGTSGFDGTYRDNMLQFGGLATGGSSPATPLLKGEELWNIDMKLDDGKPAYGKVRSRFWSGCSTATASNQLNVDYALNSSTLSCVGFFTL